MIIVDDYVIQRNSRADTVSPNHGVKPCNHQIKEELSAPRETLIKAASA